MITTEGKNKLLERIKESEKFKNSPSSRALLQYLIKKNIEGVDLKEGIIEMEYYGKNKNSTSSTPKVRVSIFHLRKKLDHYYNTEGKTEKWKLLIKKGQYNISFLNTENQFVSEVKIDIKKNIPYFLVVLLIAVLIFQNLPPKKIIVWKSFLESSKNTSLYLDEAFGMIGETVTGEIGWIHDFSITNIDEYYKLIDKEPELKKIVVPGNYQYINGSGALASKNLQELFGKYDKEFSIKFSSRVSYDDLKSRNLVFVGSSQNKKFVNMFNQSNPYFEIKRNRLFIHNYPKHKDTSFSIHASWFGPIDYALVSKLKGPNNTEQFFFFSKHEMGVVSRFSYFTNKDSLINFSEKHLKGYDNFTALYKVYGNERVDMKSEEIFILPF